MHSPNTQRPAVLSEYPTERRFRFQVYHRRPHVPGEDDMSPADLLLIRRAAARFRRVRRWYKRQANQSMRAVWREALEHDLDFPRREPRRAHGWVFV